MLQYRHGWIYFAQLNSPHQALNLLFSGNGPIRTVRQELLLYLYHPFPYLEGNWEIGQLIQVCPIFYNLIDRFLMTQTPSVASLATDRDQSGAEEDWGDEQ